MTSIVGKGGKRKCRIHYQSGVTPDMAPFFVPGCVTCEAKVAAGKLTGNEPPPPEKGHIAKTRMRSWALAQNRKAARARGLL